MTQQDFIEILTRFRNGQCLPADMDALLNAMAEAPPDGCPSWRMYRLISEGVVTAKPAVSVHSGPVPRWAQDAINKAVANERASR